MHNYHQIEFDANERQQQFRARVDQRRLELLASAERPDVTRGVVGWIANHLVRWGGSLQGQNVETTTPAQPAIIHESQQGIPQK